MFCEVERSYIEDGFNLYGLRAYVSNFSDCLDLILDRIGPDDSDDSHLTQSACTLYGLIHARYIITSHGLDLMYNKVSNNLQIFFLVYSCHYVSHHFSTLLRNQYVNKDFGTCPLLQCCTQAVLPIGLKDDMGSDTVKIFCPKCQCVYHQPLRSRNHSSSLDDFGGGSVDGAAFGTTFPHLFLLTFHNLVPEGLSPDSKYIPKVFGFRVHKTAKSKIKHDIGESNGATSVSARSNRRPSNSPVVAAASATTDALNTADVDAADAKDESVREPLGPDQQEDSTVATPPTAASENNNQSKGNKATGSNANTKKGTKVKSEEGAGSSKRKGKNSNGNSNSNSNSSNGDGEGKVKRQKRGGLKT